MFIYFSHKIRFVLALILPLTLVQIAGGNHLTNSIFKGAGSSSVTAENVLGLDTSYGKVPTAPLFQECGVLPDVMFSGDAAWGDYDNDGDLDILMTSFNDYWSTQITKIYRNDGNCVFTDINAAIEDVTGYTVTWGDYDNDGDLDILIRGINALNQSITKIYRNDGNDVFTDINVSEMMGLGLWRSLASWGDYDNDGDLDLFVSSWDDSYNGMTKIYRNDRDDIFNDINTTEFPDVWAHSMDWGDFDNDGDVDILLIGNIGLTLISKVYQNDGDGTFTDINAGLQPVNEGSVAWGDYDNDGDLDIILAGWADELGGVTRIYRNDGDGAFTDINAGLTNVARYTITAWGDYDNDGDLDILLRGCAEWDNSEGICRLGLGITKIYRNDGIGIFTDIDETLPNFWESPASWGDFDNDGDLDLLVADSYIRIYRNDTITANTVPSAPTSLVASIAGESVVLSWEAASDAQTPAEGLTYNLRVGTTPGGMQVVAPMADSSGYRRLPQRGNTDHGISAVIRNLPAGTYYWSVQAIDTAFAGSPFASEGSFTIWRSFLTIVLKAR